MVSTRARLLSLATALPPHVLPQDEIAAKAQAVFGPYFEEFERLSGIFANAGIAQRYGVRPLDWYTRPLEWPDRTEAYLEGASSLFVEAAESSLAQAGLTAADVDTVVTLSSTGIATPSLDARVFSRMGFREDVLRVPVFGRGCSGGASGLIIAARFAEARPGSIVLMVTVELCTLAFRLDDFKVANLVATALFGDGCAACVLRAGTGGIARLEGGTEHTWPDTLDVMGWSIDRQGFGVVLARSVPPFVEERFAPALDGMLSRLRLSRDAIGRFVCHPGGAKVVSAIEQSLGLVGGSLDAEREVLRDCGNMSAPTVLFILERVIRAGLPERVLLTAMGPGFTASCVSLARTDPQDRKI
jgi:alkylresorcinol/alkylpyrone synthase